MKSIHSKKWRTIIGLILLTMLIQGIYYLVNSTNTVDGHISVMNFDSFLYTQYAKSWADGHPYQFNEIDPPTTGCTSHLYPLLLGFFYKVGFRGLSLIDVAYILNSVLFILSVICYWFIMDKLCPKYKWYIVLLFIFSGHIAYGIFRLGDIGLFLLFSLLTWCLALYKRYVLLSLTMFFLPFIRPEGSIIVLVYGFFIVIEYLVLKRIDARKRIYIFSLGLLGILGVLLINYLITGMVNYDSLLNKGSFSSSLFLKFLTDSIQGIVLVYRRFLFGDYLYGNIYFVIPLISGLLIITGMVFLPWNKKIFTPPSQIVLWWLLCSLIQIIIIGQSGYVNIDYRQFEIWRYVSWILPLFYYFLITGVAVLPLKKKMITVILCLIVTIQVFYIPSFLRIITQSSSKRVPLIKEVQKTDTLISNDKRIGVYGYCGVKYLNPDWYVVDISGLTSPYFRTCKNNQAYILKKIQYTPQIQFPRFLEFSTSQVSGFWKNIPYLISDSVKVEIFNPYKETISLYNINWNLLSSANFFYDSTMEKNIRNKKLIDKLDIAYINEEEKCKYQVNSRYEYSRLQPFLAEVIFGDSPCYEAAIAVLGYDSFIFKTVVDKTHWLIVRSLVKADVICQTLEGTKKLAVNTNNVENLILKIGEESQIEINMRDYLANPKKNIREWMIEIPAEMIKDHKTRFALYGDHIVCDYWLYVDE